jgi:hypothetical protein
MRSNIISAIHHIKIARLYFENLAVEMKNGFGEKLGNKYIEKIDWIYSNFITHPKFTDEVRTGIRNEWSSDVLAIPEIMDKIGLLKPEQREMIEALADAMLAGEVINYEKIEDYAESI